MALPTSGEIRMGAISDQFPGDADPHQISEFYRNGLYVKNYIKASRIPTSGTIKWSDFYGAENSSGLSNGQLTKYIWDNKNKFVKFNNLTAQTTLEGGSYAYNPPTSYLAYTNAPEPNGGVAILRNARSRQNGTIAFKSANDTFFISENSTFCYFHDNYGGNVPANLDMQKKDGSVCPFYEHWATDPAPARGNVKLYRADGTSSNDMGTGSLAGGSESSIRPGFGACMLLPGRWDVYSDEVATAYNPTGIVNEFRYIDTPPGGICIILGPGGDGNGFYLGFYNGQTTVNTSTYRQPLESSSRCIIRVCYYFDRSLAAYVLFNTTDDWQTTTWKVEQTAVTGRTACNFYPFNSGAESIDSTAYRIVQIQKVSD